MAGPMLQWCCVAPGSMSEAAASTTRCFGICSALGCLLVDMGVPMFVLVLLCRCDKYRMFKYIRQEGTWDASACAVQL